MSAHLQSNSFNISLYCPVSLLSQTRTCSAECSLDHLYMYVSFAYTVADSCGERLASFFGITTPKYQYAIDEYYRLKEEVGFWFWKQLSSLDSFLQNDDFNFII